MTMSRWFAVPLTVLVGLQTIGCSDAADPSGRPAGQGGTGGVGGSTGGTGGKGGTGGSGGSGAGGSLPDAGGGSSVPVLINSVSGRVLDDKGAVMREVLVSVCGDQCYNGETDANGRYMVEMGVTILAETFGIMPHVDFPKARFYAPLPVGASGKVEAPDLRVLTLPDGPPLVVKSDNPDAPQQKVTSGDVTLTVDAGIQLVLSIDDVLLDTEGKKFRAMKVPADMMGSYAKGDVGLRALYAMGPFHVELRPTPGAPASAKAQISIRNSLGLSANQAVEFLSLDLGAAEPGSKPGSYRPLGKGKVSSDGMAIEMNSDQSLKYIDWIGIR